jgi:hypothetical protein
MMIVNFCSYSLRIVNGGVNAGQQGEAKPGASLHGANRILGSHRTGLRPAEMEIEKWRTETGVRNPPRTDHTVTVSEDGFEYAGANYPSLTAGRLGWNSESSSASAENKSSILRVSAFKHFGFA